MNKVIYKWKCTRDSCLHFYLDRTCFASIFKPHPLRSIAAKSFIIPFESIFKGIKSCKRIVIAKMKEELGFLKVLYLKILSLVLYNKLNVFILVLLFARYLFGRESRSFVSCSFSSCIRFLFESLCLWLKSRSLLSILFKDLFAKIVNLSRWTHCVI